MHDQPEATPEEQELVPERQQDEEAMPGPGHDDRERALKREEEEE
jgi:hypothetical protein